MGLRSTLFGIALGMMVGACNEGRGGISIEAACDVFCGEFVQCTVDNEVDEDNVMQGCMTTCRDQIEAIESDNTGDEDCEQAVRQRYRCLGAEASCEEHDSLMYGENTCRSEAFDIAEFCENPD